MSNEKELTEELSETVTEEASTVENDDSTTVLDGDIYRDMVVSAANALENEKEEIRKAILAKKNLKVQCNF